MNFNKTQWMNNLSKVMNNRKYIFYWNSMQVFKYWNCFILKFKILMKAYASNIIILTILLLEKSIGPYEIFT